MPQSHVSPIIPSQLKKKKDGGNYINRINHHEILLHGIISRSERRPAHTHTRQVRPCLVDGVPGGGVFVAEMDNQEVGFGCAGEGRGDWGEGGALFGALAGAGGGRGGG